MHTRKDFSLLKKGRAESAGKRELATFHENRRVVGMLNPMCDKNTNTHRGGEGTTPMATACPEQARAEGKSLLRVELESESDMKK